MLKIDLSRLSDSWIGSLLDSSFFKCRFLQRIYFLLWSAAGRMAQARRSQKNHLPWTCARDAQIAQLGCAGEGGEVASPTASYFRMPVDSARAWPMYDRMNRFQAELVRIGERANLERKMLCQMRRHHRIQDRRRVKSVFGHQLWMRKSFHRYVRNK